MKYNVPLYQSTNFLNGPRMYATKCISTSGIRVLSIIVSIHNLQANISGYIWSFCHPMNTQNMTVLQYK